MKSFAVKFVSGALKFCSEIELPPPNSIMLPSNAPDATNSS